MQLTVNEDCGNAPRKLVLRDFNVAWAAGDVAAVADWVTDDVWWNRVGDRVVEGKGELERAVAEMTGDAATRLRIDNIITHGATAAVNGAVELDSGSRYEFCDVYRFAGHGKNARIAEIASYAVQATGN